MDNEMRGAFAELKAIMDEGFTRMDRNFETQQVRFPDPTAEARADTRRRFGELQKEIDGPPPRSREGAWGLAFGQEELPVLDRLANDALGEHRAGESRTLDPNTL